jgi:hypothetical protein
VNKTIAGVAIAASLWCSANSQAGPEDETLERTCPHAAQAGNEAKAALARRQPPILHVTRPALQRELVEMEERDQAARDAWIEDITDRDSPHCAPWKRLTQRTFVV